MKHRILTLVLSAMIITADGKDRTLGPLQKLLHPDGVMDEPFTTYAVLARR